MTIQFNPTTPEGQRQLQQEGVPVLSHPNNWDEYPDNEPAPNLAWYDDLARSIRLDEEGE